MIFLAGIRNPIAQVARENVTPIAITIWSCFVAIAALSFNQILEPATQFGGEKSQLSSKQDI